MLDGERILMNPFKDLLLALLTSLTVFVIVVMIIDIKHAFNVFLAIFKAILGVSLIILILIAIYQFWKWVLL